MYKNAWHFSLLYISILIYVHVAALLNAQLTGFERSCIAVVDRWGF